MTWTRSAAGRIAAGREGHAGAKQDAKRARRGKCMSWDDA